MLETDDGLRIGEAMAICRFLEDEHPDPNLMGANGRRGHPAGRPDDTHH
jgi:glutathione S-transferase